MRTWRANKRRHGEHRVMGLDQFLTSLTPPGCDDETIAMSIDEFARRTDIGPLDVADFKHAIPSLAARPVWCSTP